MKYNISVFSSFIGIAFLLIAPTQLQAVPCTAGTTFYWSSDVLRWSGNDVWSFESGYIDGFYMWYWRPRVTTTSTLNSQVLFGRLNVVNTASYGEEAVNQWHDAPQDVGTGLYGVANTIEYLPDSPCDPISSINNSESLGVSRPYISGVSGIWWLGGGADAANGYYNQGLLSGNTNCGPGDTCQVPYWTVTANAEKISMSTAVGVTNIVTSEQPSGALADITIIIDIGGFQSPPFAFTVNKPYYMEPSEPYVDDLPNLDGYWSYIYYRTYDLFDNPMPSIALNEQFGAFTSDQPNNWAKPNAQGIAGFDGYDWRDNIYVFNCGGCNPLVQNPQLPLTNNKVDHADQSWRFGSSTVGDGVLVQNNTFQRYTDHGRHENIVSPVD